MRRSHQSITVCNEERSVDYSTLRGTFGPSIQYNTVQSVSSSRLQTQNTVVHTHISRNGGGVFSLFPLFLSFPSFPFFSPSFSLFFSLFSLFFLSFSSLFLSFFSFVPTPKNRRTRERIGAGIWHSSRGAGDLGPAGRLVHLKRSWSTVDQTLAEDDDRGRL